MDNEKTARLKFEKSQMVRFALIVAVTVVGTTFVYVAINGWPGTKSQSRVRGRVSNVALQQQQGGQNTILYQGQNQRQGVGRNTQGRFISGGQFICPKCGMTSLPHFDSQGNPHCPSCGNIMNINRVGVGQAAFTCPNGGCFLPNQNNPVAFACPQGGCMLPNQANPAAIACPPGGCIRANP